ncbi:MAG: hypothetical protein GY761_18115 [Hyphomicrobiales bacterium]|nr:hypothetical protein [Hyphomicrobiales bacterium]
MPSIATRLAKLETKKLPYKSRFTVIHNHIVKPSPDGPVQVGEIYEIIGGSKFDRKDYQNEAELLEAVNQEHLRVYGSPYVSDEV